MFGWFKKNQENPFQLDENTAKRAVMFGAVVRLNLILPSTQDGFVERLHSKEVRGYLFEFFGEAAGADDLRFDTTDRYLSYLSLCLHDAISEHTLHAKDYLMTSLPLAGDQEFEAGRALGKQDFQDYIAGRQRSLVGLLDLLDK